MLHRVSRFLPGRPGLMLILGVVVVVVFAAGFVDQALTRRAMLAQYEQARQKVERLEEQNHLLQQNLDRAQKGQLVPHKAWEYFGMTPRGASVIVTSPKPVSGTADAASGPPPVPEPAWRAFLQRLVQP